MQRRIRKLKKEKTKNNTKFNTTMVVQRDAVI